MALIALEGMRFYSYHGYYSEEQIFGNEYILDVYINAKTGAAAKKDDLEKTINYETVYTVCKYEMDNKDRKEDPEEVRKKKKEKRSKLLENVAMRIIASLKRQFNNIQTVKVRIRKLNPIVGGLVDQSYVEDEASFIKKCGRCGRKFVCYEDDDCWCRDLHFFPKTREAIKRQFGGCICEQCQEQYAN